MPCRMLHLCFSFDSLTGLLHLCHGSFVFLLRADLVCKEEEKDVASSTPITTPAEATNGAYIYRKLLPLANEEMFSTCAPTANRPGAFFRVRTTKTTLDSLLNRCWFISALCCSSRTSFFNMSCELLSTTRPALQMYKCATDVALVKPFLVWSVKNVMAQLLQLLTMPA